MLSEGDDYRRILILLIASAALLSNFGVTPFPFWRKRITSEDLNSAGQDLEKKCPITSVHRTALAEHFLTGESGPWRLIDAKDNSSKSNKH
ncbi:MAG: hypothetical protein GY696_32650 [Gammaproteobacteria bacterium]|nr:hypothetical protein [Gammaproteobacteria bacterium]